ncbi:MAG: hypothetical protein WC289_05465 [Patescibacteria group bacterium]|jgi:type II secretory pathway pseudopilin PulG
MRFEPIQHNQYGQTLLEVIIAISVIIAGVLGTVTLIASSVKAGRAASDRLAAVNLAREAIEIVRNMRDSNWISVPLELWNQGLYDDVSGKIAVPYIHDTNLNDPIRLAFDVTDGSPNAAFTDQASSGRRWSQVNYINGRYTQGLDVAPTGGTKFSRVIFFDTICWQLDAGVYLETIDSGTPNTSANDCLAPSTIEAGTQIRVEVRWPGTSSTDQKVVLTDRLYAWR